MPASFRGAYFHVETSVRESGRRIVPHEFPKRDVPYAEDMGRRAREFTVRGYIIVYPGEKGSGGGRPQGLDEFEQRAGDAEGQAGFKSLKSKNYLPARDKLIEALEKEGPAELRMPLLGVMKVAAVRYRVTEESKLGGFCSFDMTFVEYGQAPGEGTRDGVSQVNEAAQVASNASIDLIKVGLQALLQTPPPKLEDLTKPSDETKTTTSRSVA